ncbi:hypothetical protein CIG75_10345 [Tumebacillus algifaecis]|uniref:Carrier domain-containing protein n=1 Tax=Tumebacillus algifaecis TaxID=1214604 RepID=A0A223D1C6_9BACL|nr:non-ribosomal peptide synthetase [Tumebacillus algifaecis]ASS75351.1 hypothetical protein CIG75_10345 [Tumebacillus algifaecis]
MKTSIPIFSTLPELLQTRAHLSPEKLAYSFLTTDGDEETVTYQELDRNARMLAATLQEHSPGERVLLLYPPGLSYIRAFFGCLYAGLVPVPAYPPRTNGHLDRLQAIIHDSQAKLALTTPSILNGIELQQSNFRELQDIEWIVTSSWEGSGSTGWRPPAVDGDSLAFLQYTSGSTALPKGVMLTHHNLLHNLQAIENSFETNEASRCVIWLPPYHDMGLIGGILQPLYTGYPVTLMAPVDFIQRPYFWLQTISRLGGTVSGGPNFAYDLCVQKITPEQRDTLDLSTWKVAFTGAEPVRSETLDRFADFFAPCGFQREAFYPCYGLAEGTLFVTGGRIEEAPVIQPFNADLLQQGRASKVEPVFEHAQTLVSSGRLTDGQQSIVIASPDTLSLCSEGEVGEIWVKSPSVAQGYWNRREQTEEVFHAFLTDTGDGPFLRTGDLGFAQDQELFVTGRLKDLVIIRGRNYYPQDLEFCVQKSHQAVHNNNGAAFSIELDGEEKLVIVQEVERQYRRSNLQPVLDLIRQSIAEEYQLQVHEIVLIKPVSIPKTSSGKVQRHLCRARYLNNTLDVLCTDGSQSELLKLDQIQEERPDQSLADPQGWITDAPEQRLEKVRSHLQAQLAQLLRMTSAHPPSDRPISQFGLDSLVAVQFKDEIQGAFGVSLQLSQLLSGPTLDQLALSIIENRSAADLEETGIAPDNNELTGETTGLSYGEQSLFFLQNMHPEDTAYNIARAAKVSGAFDVDAWHRAILQLTKRHPQLRTRYTLQDGMPVRAIQETAEVGWLYQDAQAWSEVELQDRMITESHRPFDLENDCLLRTCIWKRSETEHILLLIAHHIIVDFNSFGVMVQDLQTLYQAEIRLSSDATEASSSLGYGGYESFVRKQMALLQSAEGERQRQYWHRKLGGELPVLQMPSAHARPAIQTYKGAASLFQLSADVSAGVRRLALEHGMTIYSTLLAAFQAILHRYTGQDDLLIGSPTSIIESAHEVSDIGYYVNPVVIRTDFKADPTVRELLGQVRQHVLEALDHAEYPFALLVEDLQPERDLSFPPLFQAMFTYQRSQLPELKELTAFSLGMKGGSFNLGQLAFESLPLQQNHAGFDLSLAMAEVEGTLAGRFEYNTDLFSDELIERLIEHFKTLLAAFVTSPDRLVAELPLLTESEWQQQLIDWNRSTCDFPEVLSVHRLFEEQVRRTPDRIAVSFDDVSLTYQQLDELANRRADQLLALGIEKETLVGLYLNRSHELIVSILAIWKAGGAYVPLDPSHPQERVIFTLQDARAAVLVTESSLLSTWMDEIEQVLCIDVDRKDQQMIDRQVHPQSHPHQLAYVIYTSGSTGQPKGVQIEHRSLTNLLFSLQNKLSFSERDVLVAVTTITFDISTVDLFLPLITGAQVVVANSDQVADARLLAQLLQEKNATVLQATPATWYQLINSGWQGKQDLLVMSGGESMPRALADDLLMRSREVWNLYGPTETTVYATGGRVGAQGTVLIGEALDNVEAYVLDAHLQPVPLGAKGELYVGGVCLARGYLNRLELTAEKFIPHPFSSSDEARLYKTGDIARYQADGNLEILGRVDNQVKVRGYRIELGEIEATLTEHQEVKQAAIIVTDAGDGDVRLIGFVTMKFAVTATTLKRKELRHFLKSRLPDYMVPAHLVILEEMPLTTSGKVDRKALKVPDEYYAEQAGVVQLDTETEKIVAEIWSKVLRVEQLGAQSNFFELGGHSLLATQVTTRMQDAFGLTIPLRQLFECPTVAEMASWIEGATQEAPNDLSKHRLLTPISRAGELPMSYAQQRLWTLDRLIDDPAAYNMPFAIRLQGNLKEAALEQSLSLIVNRHEALRTTFAEVDGAPIQMIAPPAPVLVMKRDLSNDSSAERELTLERLLQEVAGLAFDLQSGPLIRFCLVKTADQEHVLIINMHHIIADGWSIVLFREEFVASYSALAEGRSPDLAELSLQYADFASWQRDWLQGSVLEEQLNYWNQQLAGTLPTLELPIDHQRPALQTQRGKVERFTLSEELTVRLRALSSEHGVTMFMTLLSAFNLLLARYSGTPDICVGTPIAGRHHREVEPMIGLFVNTLVIRTDLSENLTFAELLSRVRETALNAFAHQDVPFEKLVEVLVPTRDLSRTPLFQVMFDLQEDILTKIELPDLALTPIEFDSEHAKFDLTLAMVDRERQLSGSFEYNADLFESATIKRMLVHFEQLLCSITERSTERISALSMLTSNERSTLSAYGSGVKRAIPQHLCVHQLFEAQAEKTPDSKAIEWKSGSLSYKELNRRANQLAHALIRAGVRVDQPVGLCVARSPEMIIGMLGIMKAGGAYLPLDPAYPAQRITYMLEDADADVLLTQSGCIPANVQGRTVFLLDADHDRFDQECEENPATDVRSDHLCYIIYTSGSTGAPKGVEIEHRNVVNHNLAIAEEYSLQPHDRVLQFSSISFDIAVEEIFPTLVTGGTLYIRDEEMLTTAERFLREIDERKLSVLNLPTAFWSSWTHELAELGAKLPESLRLMIVGGEKASPEALTTWQRIAPEIDWINAYGPTETTVTATLFRSKGSSTRLGSIPIGRPIANLEAHILDAHLQPVPIGVVGELYLSGAGVARGYRDRPELTASVFLNSPFHEEGSARLYKTGDLVRWLRDGQLEYVGRVDDQVKIRGFRIEAGEIESCLEQLPTIQEAIVLPVEEIPGNPRLIAYLVTSDRFDEQEVVASLKASLPDYMIPSAWVTLDKFPLLPNGKVDRRALASIQSTAPDRLTEVVPRTEMEQQLASVWEKVLRRDSVGIHQNYFELGGDSILSIQLASRAAAQGIHLSPKDLFQHPTIAQLAQVAKWANEKGTDAEEEPTAGPAPLTPIQRWFFELHHESPHQWNMPLLVDLKVPLDLQVLKESLRALFLHHDALRMRIVQTERGWEQQFDESIGDVPFERLDLTNLSADEEEAVWRAEVVKWQESLNLFTGPIARFVYLDRGENRSHRLFCLVHHLAVDGVSWRILLEDLERIYEQLLHGEAVRLLRKTTSVQRWARVLAQRAQEVEMEKELTYWLDQNVAADPLPVDDSAGRNTYSSLRRKRMFLDPASTRALLQEAPRAFRTSVQDLLVTALAQTIADWTKGEHVSLELEGHGREELFEHANLSRTVGWFTATYPIHLHLQNPDDPADSLKRVKEQLRSVPRGGVGYGLLRFIGREEGRSALRKAPQPQVLFNYHGQTDMQFDSSNLFALSAEEVVASHGADNLRSHLLEINGAIVDHRLQLDWEYSDQFHSADTIELLVNSFYDHLQKLIQLCFSPEGRGRTPSDYPNAELDQERLDRFLSQLESRGFPLENIEDLYPLSPMQQGMLYHSNLVEEKGMYLVQMTLHLRGNLKVDVLERAWQWVVDRHTILRTSFHWQSLQVPLQVVHQQVPITIRSLQEDEHQQVVQQFLDEERTVGFDLSSAPLCRLTLAEIDSEQSKLIFTSHHLVSDGWSLPLIFQELFAAYVAFDQEQLPQQPTALPFVRYIAWLQQQELQSAENFWRGYLDGFSTPLRLGIRKRGTEQTLPSSLPQEQHAALSTSVTEQLVRMSKQQQLTLNTIVQGAWSILLSRYSGNDDVLFGATFAGRPADLLGSDEMVGLFIGTLPIRVQIESTQAVLPYLRALQQRQSEVREYEYTPLVDIQKWSEVSHGQALFDTIFVFENYPMDRSLTENVGGLLVEEIMSEEWNNYPLTLTVVPGSKLMLKAMYDQSLYDDRDIERLLVHLSTLIEQIVSQPEQTIGKMPMLTAEEVNQQLVEWNDRSWMSTSDLSILRLIEEQAERTPDRTAIQFGQERLTYREVTQRVDARAQQLRALGVTRDALVGLYLNRSHEWVISILAIWKAGGAYVPLDPAHPVERVTRCLQDAQPAVLLTESKLVEPWMNEMNHLLCVDSSAELRANDQPVWEAIKSEQPAYVIYTSGSTGVPKGVQIEHRSLTDFLLTMHQRLSFSEREVLVSVTTISFDISILELFLPLISGAQVVIAEAEVAADGKRLGQLLEAAQATVLQATPATWYLLIHAGWLGKHDLRALCGGENLPRDLADDLLARVGEVWNLYGPTEATVWATAGKVALSEPVSVGRPLEHVETYVLDVSLQPLPVGVVGELYLGGSCLATGYRNAPELTANAFIPHPFASEPASRLYKTGDLARYLPDGSLEILGRTDHQVKVRGFRIELGEIEEVLLQHPEVHRAVVVVQDAAVGDKRLIAYFVQAADQPSVESGELRRFLKQRLPDYMVPSAFVSLTQLPLTPNGKVDRKALPQPAEFASAERAYVAARTETETMLSQLWSSVLRNKRIGMHDNFFELGGHSLLATQAVALMQEKMGIDLPLRTLFEHPTVAEFAAWIEERTATGNHSFAVVPQLPIARPSKLPLSFAQQRLWMLDQLLPDRAAYNMPFAVRMEGALDLAALELSLHEIICRHEILRTTFAEQAGEPIQVIHAPQQETLLVIDLSDRADGERKERLEQLIAEEEKRAFDLQVGPLLRQKLVRLGEFEHVLLMTFHHIIFDAWSIALFVEELVSLYEAAHEQTLAQLPKMELQYADFTLWQRDWLQADVMEEQIQYWKQQFHGEIPILQLATDRPRPAVQSARGAAERLVLDEELTAALRSFSQEHELTLYMTLLGAFYILLYRYTGQEDLVVGTPIAGRRHRHAEKLVGLFVNTLPLRLDLAGAPTGEEVFERVRQMMLGAYSHQDVPFERLVEELQPTRDMSRSPLFQVMFGLQSTQLTEQKLTGLTLNLIDKETPFAKFDLNLVLLEEGGTVSGWWEYNADLFDRQTIQRMMLHYQQLLRSLLEGSTSQPEQAIGKLPMLTVEEVNQQLVEWNNRSWMSNSDLSVLHLIEEQAERTPDRTAIQFGQERLTYREVTQRVAARAQQLRALGVTRDALVGLYLNRSHEWVISILAIWKAGGAYVPLDPAHPVERVTRCLQDAQPAVLLTESKLVEPWMNEMKHLLCVDSAVEVRANDQPVWEAIKSEQPAYVIYTSGSTGVPKGVQIEHRSLTDFLLTIQQRLSFSEREVLVSVTTISFDISILELFLPLISGAQVVIAEAEVAADGKRLGQLLEAAQATVLQATPATWYLLIHAGWLGKHDLRALCGGENLPRDLADDLLTRVGEVWNLYGPTEATVWATAGKVALSEPVSVGRPLEHVETYVLDASLQPLPVGAVGELYLGGSCLATGYRNAAELTAKAFLPHPFASGPASRLYKTGDLARYLPDGSLEILGRIDHQVKVRGFRIELGEIEEVLSQHPEVHRAVVVVQDAEVGDKRLIAYFVQTADQPSVESGELRRFLKQRLPDYMVPSAFVSLTQLPLTPSGKVDRKALPQPADFVSAERAYVAPRTETETMLTQLWSSVLRVDRIGMHDNFFELGGHSLLATQAVALMQEKMRIDLPLRALFEHPTVAEFAAWIEERTATGDLSFAVLPQLPIARPSKLPLSFAQQRLWMLDQLLPDRAAYNMPFAVRMEGALDLAALELSLHEIICRHEILRTTFAEQAGEPIQVIHAPQPETLAVIDLSDRADGERKERLEQLITEEEKRAFDLQVGPLLRRTLVRMGEEEHVLLMTFHHIIFDAWSIALFVEELVSLYEAAHEQTLAQLPKMELQYADFTLWQRDWLQADVMEEQIQYWKQQFHGEIPILQLATDRPRPAIQSARGAAERLVLDEELTAALRSFSHEHELTLFMTLLGAFYILLYRYSGQEDLVIGTPIAGRRHRHAEKLIGLFVNTLPLRLDLSGAPTGAELFERVRQMMLGAYSHQDVPFERLVEELQPTRDMSRSPLFQVMFGLQSTQLTEQKLSGLNLNLIDKETPFAKFDLNLVLLEEGGKVSGWWEYNADLFDRTTIQRMMQHYEQLLRSILNGPVSEISRLPLLAASERARLLQLPHPAEMRRSSEQTLHQQFEAMVERTPDRVALVFESNSLTYRELNERANRVAAHLLSLGVQPNTLVGLCTERSLELVIGLLAILKAGGAYVPLDPAYPADRLAFLLQDASLSILLTQQHLRNTLPAHRAQVVCLDDHALFASASADNLHSAATAESIAYVIYTSGSTGQPKGVPIPHANVIRLFTSTAHWFPFAEDDVWTLFHSFSFDFSVWELWGALLHGGKAVIVPYWISRSPEAFLHLLASERVTVLNQTPSAFRQLMQAEAAQSDRQALSLRWVIFGGEALDLPALRPWFDRHGDQSPQLINMYGITETTVHVTYRPLKREDALRANSVIGHPIPDLEVYVLDPHLEPVPIGVAGELYVSGAGVAPGYLHRPELTAERFLHHPFRAEAQARLYKTGDLARRLPSGELEYLGRIDHQVKIRGFRIELGEIESMIGHHPGVRETAVLVREDRADDKQIVAYVVTHVGTELQPSDLLSHCKERLPDYMVPAAFVLLDALPLTHNGKLDRNALPAPIGQQKDRTIRSQPESATEIAISEIWKEVLGVEQIDREDNFFDLGGHSLRATQAVSRIGATLGIKLSLRTLFETPTLRLLAEEVQHQQMKEMPVSTQAICQQSRIGEIPLSFAQERLWVLDRLMPGNTAYNIPFALSMIGELDDEALEWSINEIIKRHEILRTTLHQVESSAVQRIAKPDWQRLTRTDLRSLSSADWEREVSARLQAETERVFDLTAGPLLYVELLQRASDDHALVINMHHIISDGWSIGLLVQEIGALYTAYVEGQTSPLADLSIQYADYAIWQREWLAGQRWDEQLSYWKTQLGGSLPALQLPTDHPRPPVQSYRGASFAFAIDKVVVEALEAIGKSHSATLFMTLFSVFQTLLYRYTGQEDLVVGTPIAGRQQQETEGLIGFFVNTLVMRTDLSARQTFVELLAQVRQTALDAYTHQDIPFEKLVAELQPIRDRSRSPLFQAMFALQSASQACLSLPGLAIQQIEGATTTAKFDLSVTFEESEQGLNGHLEYSTDLFEASTIARMADHLVTLMNSVIENPNTPVSELQMVTEAEKRLFSEWNGELPSPADQCVHRLFESQVIRTPDRIAVEHEGNELSYRELNARANQLARHLQALGVGPEMPVTFCLDRSLDLVIAQLAILKAGGAYVPIDPNNPPERTAFILQDTNALVMVAHSHLIRELPNLPAQLVCLDQDEDVLSAYSGEDVSSDVRPDHLAYLIYTSGSTGRPKAVAVEHRNVLSTLLIAQEQFVFRESDVIMWTSSAAFDISQFELWSTLFVGGRILLLSRDHILNIDRMIVDLTRATVVNFVPNLMRRVIEATKSAIQEGTRFDNLRYLFIGGDAVPPQMLVETNQTFPRTDTYVLYGPTEASIFATSHLAKRGEEGDRILIGKRCLNAQLYICDPFDQEVPLGVPGELQIGGLGVAREYFGREELTAEKFVTVDGQRRYKTGDLVRYLPDGSIEFLGRIDGQVKIRGFRIEIGEIEAALTQQPDIVDAVVQVHETAAGEKRLIAYVARSEEGKLDVRSLRHELQKRLPDYMIPARFIQLEALPLNPNGKVDRKALQTLEWPAMDSEDFAQPSTPTETKVAAIVANLLSLQQIGVHDNFFELGGHSLLAMQAIAEIRAELKVEVPLSALFEAPSIAELSAMIDILLNETPQQESSIKRASRSAHARRR